MDSKPVPFNLDAPLGDRRAIIRRNPDDQQEIEMVEAVWGSDPRFGAGTSYRFIRAEDRTFPSNRCLIAASEFHIRSRDKQYRVTLDTGNFFYLAAIWDPAMADWPLSYKVITVWANTEVSSHQERHGAIIRRHQVMHWLDGTMPESELLLTPPPRTFIVEQVFAGDQRVFALGASQ